MPKTMQTDEQIAAHALRCIFGCGVPESIDRVAALDESIVKEIARYEREGRRQNIPLLLQPSDPAADVADAEPPTAAPRVGRPKKQPSAD